MNAGSYLELCNGSLQVYFKNGKVGAFMLDDAPYYTRNVVNHWLDDCAVDYFSDWLNYGSDLHSG